MAILDDSFENLEQVPKRVGKQIVKLSTDIVQGAVKSVVGGGKGLQVDPLTGIEVPSPQKIKQLKKQEKKVKAAGIPHAQQIIAGLQKPLPAGVLAKTGQIPAYISGKPGFSEGKAVQQMQGLEEKKKKLPPPVSASKPKMGTGERKIMGSSG